jgi:hypothetical protein
MKFPLASYDGLDFRVLLIRPNWAEAPVITHFAETLIGEGRTTIEERRPERDAPIISQRVVLSLLDSAADDWRKGLAALGVLRVAMPIWIDALPTTSWSQRIYASQKVINFDADSGDFQIYEASALPSSPTYPLYAPLMLGRWNSRPAAAAETDEVADVTIELREDSPYSWRIGVNSNGSSWTQVPNWISPIKDASDYGLEQIKISSAREAAIDRANAAARWTQEAEFLFGSRLEIRTALTWFIAKRGSWASWAPVPAWFQPGASTSGTPDNYVARFASDTLTLTYAAPECASSKIGFIQEINTPTRLQALPAEACLYRLSYDPDSGNPELFTDWDAPLSAAEGNYEPRQIANQDILLSLKPQDEKAEIQLAYAAGSLIADWILARLFGLVRLTIWKCDPADPDGSRGDPIFSGIVQDVRPEGNLCTLTATLFGALLKRRTPGWVFGPRCNTYVFSPVCKLVESTYRSSGTAAAADLSSDRMTLTVHGVTGWGGPTYADNLFAYGIVRTGSGRSFQTASIVSSAMSAGNVVVKMNRPLWPDLISGTQAVQLVPGCGGQYEADCGDKFDNQENFRGFPFIPEYIETRDVSAPKAPKK